MDEHLVHLRTALELLRQHHLHAKFSKCRFATNEVDYLGHVISSKGLSVDQRKISCIQTWPLPKTPRALRRFLGLAEYYRKFIRDFGKIVDPLTSMLKKNSFVWFGESTRAFELLKQVMSTPLVLALPDFTKPFVIECDSKNGVLIF